MVKGVFECNGCYDFTDEQEQEARTVLQTAYDEMKKTLAQNEEKLKVSLAEAEEKHQKAVETIAQLEGKNFDLLNKVKRLKDTVQDMGDQLIETNLECDELISRQEREQEAYNILQEEYDELKETLIRNEELQKVSSAEAKEKHQKAVETIAQLEMEVSDLTKQMETQRRTVRDIGTDACELNTQCDKLTNREAFIVLQTEYDEMKKTLMHKEEILQVSLAERQNAAETIAQLEAEKSMLRTQTETLRETVEDVQDLLCESHKQCEQQTKECERQQEAYSRLQAENNELKKTLKQTKKFVTVSLAEVEEKHQKAVETIAQLEEESDLLKQVVLAEAEEKHQKAVATIDQLEEDKTDLTNQLETLRVAVQDLGYDLYVTNRECDELTDVREREQEAHGILQSEHQVTKEQLKRCEGLLVASTEEKEPKSLQSSDKREAEKSCLKSHVDTVRYTLRGKVKDIKNRLSKPHKDKLDKSAEPKEPKKTETETKENRSESSSESM